MFGQGMAGLIRLR